MRSKTDGYKLLAALGALALVFGLLLFAGLPALGAGGDCKTYHNHNGHLPDEYDYGVFIEHRPAVNITSTHSENPRDYGAGRTWDIVKKCKYPVTTTTAPTTTTTAPSETTTTLGTTTTLPEATTSSTTVDTTSSTVSSTTTSVPSLPSTTNPATTTTAPIESTTVPDTSTVPDVSADWYANAACYEDGGYIDVEFDPTEIPAVDVYMWDPITPPADWYHVARWTEPGSYKTSVGSPTVFLLIPVVTTGYTATEIGVTVDRCTTPTSQASSTSVPDAPQTPSTPDLDELPYTGVPVHVWAILGLVALGSGTALVRWTRA